MFLDLTSFLIKIISKEGQTLILLYFFASLVVIGNLQGELVLGSDEFPRSSMFETI